MSASEEAKLQFMEVTGVDDMAVATHFLEAFGGDLEAAVTNYMMGGLTEDNSSADRVVSNQTYNHWSSHNSVSSKGRGERREREPGTGYRRHQEKHGGISGGESP